MSPSVRFFAFGQSSLFAGVILRNAPPYLSFRLAEKKDSAAPGGRKKREPTRSTAVQVASLASRSSKMVQLRYEIYSSMRNRPRKLALLAPLPGLLHLVAAAPRGIQRGSADPPWPFQLGRVKGGRDASQTCRWHVCSQSGEQAVLATRAREYGIFPSLVAFLLQLFFGQSKKS